MARYWLRVVDYDEYKPVKSTGEVIGFQDRWGDSVKRIKENDQIITYVTRISEFTGLSIVTGGYRFDKKDPAHPHKIKVEHLDVSPVPAKPLIPQLTFVTNKKRWYVHFNKSIYEIPAHDFEKVKRELLDRRRGKEAGEKKADEGRTRKLKEEISLRAPTGIQGLDDILEGGFPINSTILITGGPGAGKTILCLQFLLYGVEHGEPGVFISMDERPDDLRKEALKFGWDLTKYEEEGKLVIVDVSYPRSGLPSKEKYQLEMPFTLDMIVRKVYEVISEIGAKRVIIDSLPAFGLHFEDEAEVRIAIHRLNNLLLSSGCTSIITSEIIPGNEGVSRFGVEEFIARGIILMEIYREGKEFHRAMTVLKMRETNYELRRFGFKIDPKQGIVVLPHKVVFFDEASRFI
ncbi:MAG: EVE domain-containing protein [Methanobacteriota archaeon]|nr:MAG: EVE domain-containing protein [Euryarchaeota archaeon]